LSRFVKEAMLVRTNLLPSNQLVFVVYTILQLSLKLHVNVSLSNFVC